MKKQHVPSFLTLIWQVLGVIFVTMAFYSVIQSGRTYHGIWRSPVFFRTLSEIFLTLSISHCLALLRNYLLKTIPDNKILRTINTFLRLDSDYDRASMRIASHLVGATVAFLLSLIVLRSIDPISRLLGLDYSTYNRSLSGVRWALGITTILTWYFFVRSMIIKAMQYGSLPSWLPPAFLVSSGSEKADGGGLLGILRQSLTFHLILFSFGILVVVEVVTSFFPFRDVDAQVSSFIDWRTERIAPKSSVVFVTLRTRDKDVKKYLKFSLKMVDDLKRAGAKIVVVDYGSAIYAGTQIQVDYAKKFEAEGIAVLGVDKFTEYHYEDSLGRTSFGPLFKAFGYGVRPEFNTTSAVRRIGIYPELLKFNLMCELLKRYAGYPAATEFQSETNGLRYGSYRIPLDEYGFFLIHAKRPRGVSYFSFGAKEQLNGDFVYVKNPYGPVSPAIDVKTYAEKLNGKIVFIQWFCSNEWMSNDEWDSFFTPIYGIEDILAHQCLESSRWGHLPLLLSLLLVSVLLCAFLPVRYAILFLIVITVGALYFCSWLFQSRDILIHSSSVLFSLVLADAILPAVRLANDIRSSKQKLD